MRYAILNAAGVCMNAIEWDGIAPITLPDGCTAVQDDAGQHNPTLPSASVQAYLATFPA